MRCIKVTTLCFSLAALLVNPAWGQNELVPAIGKDTSKSADRISIDHADYMKRVLNETDITYMRGNVELSQDSIFMYCDSAVVIDKRQVFAFGNVLIQKGDSLEIYTDTLEYNSATRIAVLRGEVVLKHDDEQLWTTHLTFDLNRDLARYDKTAVLFNDSTQVSSKVGYYWVNADSFKLVDSVVVIGEHVTLLTDSMIYETALQRAVFIAKTRIYQDESRIYCEAGYYDVPDQNAEFRQNAEYHNDTQHAWADTITYLGADSLVTMRGNVRYEEEDRRITSDFMRYYESTGQTEIIGNAVFTDSLRDIQGEQIHYNRTTEQFKTLGRSTLKEGAQLLVADTIEFDQKSGMGNAWGHVIFRDTSANATIFCDNAYYTDEREYVKAFGKRRPLLKIEMDEDTLFLTSDTLVMQSVVEMPDTMTTDTFRTFDAFFDVRMHRGTMQGVCDSLTFHSKDSIFHMLGQPVLWSDTTQFIADTIDIQLRNEKIDKVWLNQNAIIISIVESAFYDQIKGKNMVARFVDDELHDLHVRGNAESIYYARDEEEAFIGVNKIASSEIYFTFENSGLNDIRFFGQPTGNMIPMREADHTGMRLEGFAWKEQVRPRKIEDLF